jgi:hypothetical protein
MFSSPGGSASILSASDGIEPNLDRATGDVIDGEAIIINLVSGAYYSMQGIGGEVWSMIAAHRTVGSMLNEIVSRFDVSAEEARLDLDTVLGQLLEEGLVRVSSPGEGACVGTSDASPRKPYERPLLQVYRDMEELLALDPPAPGMNEIAWDNRGSTRSK